MVRNHGSCYRRQEPEIRLIPAFMEYPASPYFRILRRNPMKRTVLSLIAVFLPLYIISYGFWRQSFFLKGEEAPVPVRDINYLYIPFHCHEGTFFF